HRGSVNRGALLGTQGRIPAAQSGRGATCAGDRGRTANSGCQHRCRIYRGNWSRRKWRGPTFAVATRAAGPGGPAGATGVTQNTAERWGGGGGEKGNPGPTGRGSGGAPPKTRGPGPPPAIISAIIWRILVGSCEHVIGSPETD